MARDAAIDDGSPQAGVPRWAPRLAMALRVLGLVAATETVLAFLNRSVLHDLNEVNITDIVLPIGFSLIGALLAARRPRNPIGWMFLVMAVLMGARRHRHPVRDP